MYIDKKTLGSFLKKSRLHAGYSQEDVSKELGYTSPQFISNWERGLSSPPLDTLVVVSKLYKVPERTVLDVILGETKKVMKAQFTANRRRRH